MRIRGLFKEHTEKVEIMKQIERARGDSGPPNQLYQNTSFDIADFGCCCSAEVDPPPLPDPAYTNLCTQGLAVVLRISTKIQGQPCLANSAERLTLVIFLGQVGRQNGIRTQLL